MTGTTDPSASGAGIASHEPLLKLRGIGKHFGAVQALSDVDLDLPAGQVTALCGDNGAGKSVLTKCIAGIHEPDHGEMYWEGRPCRIRTPKDAAALGIETVYQDLALADNLDIVQNMFLGRERSNRWLSRRGRHGERGGRDPREPAGDHGPIDPTTRGDALGRPAPGRGGRPCGHVELPARHAR